MRQYIKTFLLTLSMMISSAAMYAQDITSVHGVVSDDLGPLMGATVCEIDGNGRIIESAITDMNGNFVMKVRNASAHKIRFSYVGLDTKTMKIDKTTYDVKLESKTVLQEVTIKSKKRMNGSGLPIPEREVSFAVQSISTKEFEGLGVNSIDEALQGRIAGLDIVSGGNLGSGSTIRLRGGGSMSGLSSENPLIVVDGNIRKVEESNFDFANADQEQFAELLNVNPEDIASINVIKDGAGAAIYGSDGANGVIEIITKRGKRGKPRVTYTGSIKASHIYFPESMKLLNGDEYTMLLKEEYFNPSQDDGASNVRELNYDKTFSQYEQYNNNTDWIDAVTQTGILQKNYLTIEGGGEKAAFRISGGFDTQTGQIIKQGFNRFTTRLNLDYNVSERIKVQTNFGMTYTKNKQNYDNNILSIARRKMPNMSIYEQDADGNDTDVFYNMLQSGADMGSEVFKNDQRTYYNPVACAHLAKRTQSTYDINPELVINYELWGMDEDHHRLTWRGQVYMNIWNEYYDSFYPSSLLSTVWDAGHNTANSGSSKSVSLTTKHTLTFTPAFKNKDHSLMAMARFELSTGSTNGQSTSSYLLPSGGIESPFAGGITGGMSSSYWESKSMRMAFSTNYSYKQRYVALFSLVADGTTKFGEKKRWGYNPAVSLRWNVIDEPFMEWARGWLSMLSIRPSWAYSVVAPRDNYLYTAVYNNLGSYNQYMGMTSMYPANLMLSDLKWATWNKFNIGFDVHFLNDKINLSFEMYNNTLKNDFMGGYRIPSSTGFETLAYKNDGKKRDTGWEFTIETRKLIKKGKFSMDTYVNFGNNRSEILEMDENILKNINTTFKYENAQVLTRLQIGNPFGSIYGFRSKGVYQYNYSWLETEFKQTGLADSQYENWINQQLASGKTFPVALKPDGTVVMDDEGKPVRMKFGYSNNSSEGVNSGNGYNFCGGDAYYEDVNNDGQINALDIVYLGSSLPKLTGGFGFTFNYGDWSLRTNFSFRVGNKILNRARLISEAMTGNDNQSQAVNYRWRKNGDVTTIPRAMYNASSNFNTLISDRCVENGSFLRMTYLALSYQLKKKYLKGTGLNKMNFTFTADNLFVLTKYTGIDPDISYNGFSPATDWGQTPRSRGYTFSMTVGF